VVWVRKYLVLLEVRQDNLPVLVVKSFRFHNLAVPLMDHLTNPLGERLRILAADSTSMSTQLLVEALAKNPQFQLIEAPSAEPEILALVKREKPHVTLISARFGQNGHGVFDLIRSIRSLNSASRVILMLDHSEPATVVQAFRSGAHGIFCRTEPFRLLTKCIECVHAGQVWASSSELHYLLDAFRQAGGANKLQALINSPLSARETDVVRCVAEGLTNREIAQRLHLTEHTVKNYLFRIFDKLGVSSRVEVVLFALGNTEPRTPPASDGRKTNGSNGHRKMQAAAVTARKNGL
jgi:two-component system nitrate/nitrite response regulator NarL